jgi:telomere length regulation protein
VDLTIALVGLKDTYELDGFEDKRQCALTALVECSPRKAAM